MVRVHRSIFFVFLAVTVFGVIPGWSQSVTGISKEHARHLVGGRAPLATDERLLRFVFPERPGALLKFLSSMNPAWNISLFHYRNQGADYGRVLVGLQIPAGEEAELQRFLKDLDYPWVDETTNPVYRLFLR